MSQFKKHILQVYPSSKKIPKEEQLAWKLAQKALDPSPISSSVEDMVINRIIDNASVASASLFREPVLHAREQALAHPRKLGACLFGLSNEYRFDADWAAWANGTAVRELDFHDTFLSADYSHPADNIPPILAVAQQLNCSGEQVVKAIVAAYEIHITLVKAICLHEHKVDHIAHLCPAQAAGIGVLLNLSQEVLYQAIQQAVHVSFTTRQSRKGEISSWKAYAPGFSGKLAVEAIDRSMRGEGSPSPIYEGEDSVVAWFLDGKEASYEVPLLPIGEEKKMILESYTKAHSAEYQSQALIDLAFEMGKKIKDFSTIKEIIIYTSHHTHFVIGTGSGDPQKVNPNSSRETLDHSIMYIFAVALQDGKWHHIDSYTRERASRPDTVELYSKKIKTFEDEHWTKMYHAKDPKDRQFGGRVEIHFKDGSVLKGEKGIADAHPFGKNPYQRKDYIQKFLSLSKEHISNSEQDRFLNVVQDISKLPGDKAGDLNLQASLKADSTTKGIF